MGPKKIADEVEDIKISLNTLIHEVTAVKDQQAQLLTLLEEVKQLRCLNAEKERRIVELESRVNELEQHSRMNDVVITGLMIKPRSYARAVVSDAGQPSESETQSVEQQVASFLRSKGIEMDLEHIEACHQIPTRGSRKPMVIMRFVNRRNKVALLKQGRKLKDTDVYMNDNLTKHNADIARKARQLKKQNKIQHTWVANCRVLVKLNGTPEEAKVIAVRSIEELDKLT